MSDRDTPKPGEKSETVSAVRDSLGGFAAKMLASLTTSAQSFAEIAAMADLYEREAANIALRRSQRADVKNFAQQMIKDHTRTTEDLKSMMGSLNEPVEPPTELNPLFQTLIDDLKGASNENFDTRYIAQQESVHSAAITLVKTYRDRGDNSALRELSKLAVPVFEHHLEMAHRMAEAA